MNLIIGYPTWFIGLCVLVGLLYALGLYYRERSGFGEMSNRYNTILGILRWATVTIICLLLLDPVMRSTITEKKQPIVVLAQDNSESIRAGMSDEARATYADAMAQLQKKLEEKYEVKTYSFGDEVRTPIKYEYADKITNIAKIFDEMYDVYSNQNLSTIIVASDGIFNQGNSPIYSAAKLNVPIFTIALGDTVPKRDLILKKTYNNQIAYLGDKFSVQIDIAAVNCADNASKLVIRRGGATVLEKPFNVDKADFFRTEEVLLDATQSGVQKYNVSLVPINGEVTTVNNSKDIYIEVLDSRQRILILAESPHPDLGTLKRMIAENKNYQAEIFYPETLKESAAKYDFVILHQLPSTRNNITTTLAALNEKKVPHLFIVGTQTQLSALNQAQDVMVINGRPNQTNDVSGMLAPTFTTFTLDKRVSENLPKFPPLVAPFGDFNARANATVLLTQKIGSVDTKYPLLAFGEQRGTKKAVLAAEGIWKWRMFDYMQSQNFETFDELFNKLLVYMSAKEDKRKFRAFASNTLYRENEKISIDAELYNANYERINEPEATVEITDGAGKKYPFTFIKTANAYALNVGLLPVGDYKFEAKTNYGGEKLMAGGAFSVQAIQLEVFETTADHRLLQALSQKNGGTMVFADQVLQLAEMIEAKGFAKPILYDTVSTRSLIHLKWIFFLLFTLLSVEWFLRRYWGSY